MEMTTPAGLRMPVHPPPSAFRNVSYQRATHDSLMCDSVVNQSPANDTITAGKDTAATASGSNVAINDKLSVENSKVRVR